MMRRRQRAAGGSCVAVFAKLRQIRSFERRFLSALTKLEDFDLVREIGYHQEQGRPLTMKRLYLLNLGSVATVQRRLRRLRQLGVILQRKLDRDARSVELLISPKLMTTYSKYTELLQAIDREP